MNKCNLCGKLTNNPKFCSRSCSAKVSNQKRWTDHETQFGACKDCGADIVKKNKYCHECLALKFNFNNWAEMTLGEVRAKRKYQPHSLVRNHARSLYLKSEKPKFCIECGYELHFDVCHVKDIFQYSADTKLEVINSLDNLVALCKKHHWEFDNGYLAIKDISKESLTKWKCLDCGNKVYVDSTRCHPCNQKYRILNSKTKEDWPDFKTLVLKTCGSSYRAMGKKLGKSDKAVKDHIVRRLDLLLKDIDL